MNGMPNSSAVIVVRRRASRPSDAPAAPTLVRTLDQIRSVNRFAIAASVAQPARRARATERRGHWIDGKTCENSIATASVAR